MEINEARELDRTVGLDNCPVGLEKLITQQVTRKKSQWFYGHLCDKVLLKKLYLPSRPRIIIENENLLPEPPFIVAMNHSDAYSYAPFQIELIKLGLYSSAWVKWKHMASNKFANWFFRQNGMIPIPSRKEVIQVIHDQKKGLLAERDYQTIKNYYDGKIETPPESQEIDHLIEKKDSIIAYHKLLYQEAMNLTMRSIEAGSYILIFPEGSRNKVIQQGYDGIINLAKQTKLPIVPVGCNNGDLIWPGMNPLPRSGTLVYRIGSKINVSSQTNIYQVMNKINDLLDTQHQNHALYESQ